MNFRIIVSASAALLALAAPAESQPPRTPQLTYADLADLALPAPVAAHVQVRRAVKLKPEQAVGIAPGQTRFYVEAEVLSLIRSPEGLPTRISYLVDLPNDEEGRPPKLAKKSQFLLLGQTVPGRPGELRLGARDAQIPYTAASADQLRAIYAEAARTDAPPAIGGIGRAFHVPGSIPGESETQLFLLASDGRPVSLTVLRRPGQTPQWAVALSEIVDDAAAPPQPNSLLWYRLACGLPANLPTQSLSEADAQYSAAIRADYRLIKERLGPCLRSRRTR